ncbi:DeoR family transcriptional regulator [Brevibacillus laterosporus]|uniref:DeoR family transcriptional regulator n=1 Tax=Brevibacillus laterosporus TaxID=1465 RepID=UPI00264BB1FA|nr:DeoR family transcriptional regulator [Brevibacillus laterosporus]MDN9010144.1 DeoR family transcriptional regulator [Brevibacillus laterosporus]MDO0941398.1 DeoR family transcriptional regulator [Brevibacillus laterosporus]
MLPIERKQQILLWLEEEECLRISEISKRLEVSEMTIYRDIKPLIAQRKISRTSKGIRLIKQQQMLYNRCSYCHKAFHSRLSVQLIKSNQQVEQTCCAHCALLRYQNCREDVVQIICRDFLTDTTISAKMACFLLHADINLHCCQPQALPFESVHQAKQFQCGFGGVIYDFEGAILAIQTAMTGSACCHKET